MTVRADALADGVDGRRTFEIHQCLGRGGFGEVYRATLVSAGGVTTEVALKVLHEQVGLDDPGVRRLRDEGRLLGLVNHPVALRVFDLVLLGGRVGLVTEYVEGQDLDRALRGRDRLTFRASVQVLSRVASALDAAWTTVPPGYDRPLRLVHRDVKPANIRIGRHGQVKLLDFGIARAAMDREAKTETDAVLGSTHYMAPERYLDEVEAGSVSDVFSLGCTLYECLCGVRYYEGQSLRQVYLMALETEEHEAFLTERLAEVPAGAASVRPLLKRMLSWRPDRRPSASAVSSNLALLAPKLEGPGLDRWAAGRNWPAVPAVQGLLDGEVLSEGSSMPESSGTLERRVPSSEEDQTSGKSWAPVWLGLLLSSIGLLGLVAALGVLGLAWWTLPAWMPGDEAALVVPATPQAAPGPSPAPLSAPMPAPNAEPVSIQPAPVPAPVPAPAPAPAPAPVVETAPEAPPEPAWISVEGGMLVEFHGDSGIHRAGNVPPGSYEIRADLGSGELVPAGSLYVGPGSRNRVRCSRLRRQCVVD